MTDLRAKKVGRDQMRIDTEPEHAQSVLQIMVPDRLVPFEKLLAAPNVIHQDIKAALLAPDVVERTSSATRWST